MIPLCIGEYARVEFYNKEAHINLVNYGSTLGNYICQEVDCFILHFFLVTNKKPLQVSITKVKQFEGSSSFVRRSQWMLDQLRQVNGIDPNRDCVEFDLMFDNAFDQWTAGSPSEKGTFFQILHNACQRYLSDRKPEFINCKVLTGNSILHSAADSVTSAVQKASQALNERGERLSRAEEKTEDLKNSAQQFAETAHKLAMKHKC
ncbi:syntaxin-binding protein 6 [Protopterus annectens]|uniref:syntaxin-binding protein 6 n=1 Tax=Protopterus annectens TaxID=7888 RepID=UPI001CFBF4F8|nr:syntaxin-binding protein 6 [Protopterus annectens]